MNGRHTEASRTTLSWTPGAQTLLIPTDLCSENRTWQKKRLVEVQSDNPVCLVPLRVLSGTQLITQFDSLGVWTGMDYEGLVRIGRGKEGESEVPLPCWIACDTSREPSTCVSFVSVSFLA